MADSKGKYKVNITDKSGDTNQVDLVYGASTDEFMLWLKNNERIYVPFYKGLTIHPNERLIEIDMVAKSGKLKAELTGAGESMEFEH